MITCPKCGNGNCGYEEDIEDEDEDDAEPYYCNACGFTWNEEKEFAMQEESVKEYKSFIAKLEEIETPQKVWLRSTHKPPLNDDNAECIHINISKKMVLDNGTIILVAHMLDSTYENKRE